MVCDPPVVEAPSFSLRQQQQGLIFGLYPVSGALVSHGDSYSCTLYLCMMCVGDGGVRLGCFFSCRASIDWGGRLVRGLLEIFILEHIC